MEKIMFYIPKPVLGGVEMAVYNLARMLLHTMEFDVSLCYEDGDDKMIKVFDEIMFTKRLCHDRVGRVGGVTRVERSKKPQHVDVLVYCSPFCKKDISEFVTSSRKVAWLHCPRSLLKGPLGFEDMPKVFVSQWQYETFSLEVPRSEYHVIPNILDVNNIMRKSSKIMPDLMKGLQTLWPDGYLRGLMVCRISPEKGWVRALEILNEREDLFLVIVGEPHVEAAWQYVPDELLNHERSLFIGPRANPYPYMRNADFLFMLSDFETFGMVTLEAQALGTPVVWYPFTDDPTVPHGNYDWKDFPTSPERLPLYEPQNDYIVKRWSAILKGGQ